MKTFTFKSTLGPIPGPRLPLNSVDYSVLREANKCPVGLKRGRFDDGASWSQTLTVLSCCPRHVTTRDEVCKTIHHYLLIQISWKANGHIAFRRMA